MTNLTAELVVTGGMLARVGEWKWKAARVVVLASLMATACIHLGGAANQVSNTLNNTTNALNDAITALNNNSSEWQAILEDTVAKFNSDTQSTIRDELTNLLHESIAAAGSEVRCDFDFVGQRVVEVLIRIRNTLLHRPVPPATPVICDFVPTSIDMSLSPERRNVLDIFGYNFDSASPIQAFVVDKMGGQFEVTSFLDRQTFYHMTLNLGANGVSLSNVSQRIVLLWQGREISSLPVIQPGIPTCQTHFVDFNGGTRSFIPPHVGGDLDFFGHGPNVTMSVVLTNQATSVTATIAMTAIETRSDWTTASGQDTFTLYTPPSGMQIVDVLTPPASPVSYEDTTTGVNDQFDLGLGGLVTRVLFVGDTDGPDAGVRTKVDVTFNQRLQFKLIETGNCVPPSS